jgi:hypothetical protein
MFYYALILYAVAAIVFSVVILEAEKWPVED